jgi:nitroreductase
MNLFEIIQGRRSVRKYQPDPVPKETLLKLLQAAVWAPSGGNAQTWRFVVITDDKVMKKIKMVSPGLLGDPPAIIVIAQDMERAQRKGGIMGHETLTKMDSAMAAQNILLSAYAMDLGACVIASFHAGAVGKLLGMPENVKPQLMISLGTPAHEPKAPPRRFEELIWWEAYDG